MVERWLFVSDVDDTLLGNNSALATLMTTLQTAAGRVITAYNSSRPCASLRQSLANVPQLPSPDYLIGGLGTEIQAGVSGKMLTEYTEFLDQNWQRPKIVTLMNQLGLVAHPIEYQTPLKASFDLPDPARLTRVKEQLRTENLAAKIIFSGGKNLDIIPQAAGKGGVVDYLRRQLDISAEQVVVAGDSGNDVDMFIPPYRGIVVGNADPDLKQLKGEHIYHARAFYAAGVLEGLKYWQVV